MYSKRPQGRPRRDPIVADVFLHFRAGAALGQAAGRPTWYGPSKPENFLKEARAEMHKYGVNIQGDKDFKKRFMPSKGAEAWAAYEEDCRRFVISRLAFLFDEVVVPEPAI